ncbi:hypothetical protein CCACVL1_17211 [Corchorus capsularis]|uniref:Uncharacterized protein n=1 Tax=Corchorus capsularis TaxID=210143 RepID=A0A1R3HT90_COCAP|nr:hypothetical protein CCACVL1_17211 [Corchorus capsularis]
MDFDAFVYKYSAFLVSEAKFAGITNFDASLQEISISV